MIQNAMYALKALRGLLPHPFYPVRCEDTRSSRSQCYVAARQFQGGEEGRNQGT